MCPQVDLRRSKLLWLEADRLKAIAKRSAEMVVRNAEEHDKRAKEAARQKGPHRWGCWAMLRALAPGLAARAHMALRPRACMHTLCKHCLLQVLHCLWGCALAQGAQQACLARKAEAPICCLTAAPRSLQGQGSVVGMLLDERTCSCSAEPMLLRTSNAGRRRPS